MKVDLPQNTLQPRAFDAYPKDDPIRQALGSGRVQTRWEAGTIQSANFVPGVSGWRITPRSIDINSFLFLAGSVPISALANISTDRLLGRDTASSGAIEEISIGGGLEFTGSVSIQTSAFSGDVTKSAGGTALTIANDAVTFAKMQNINTAKLIGRTTASSGDPEEVGAGNGISIAGGTVTVVTQMSVAIDGSGVKLSGDASTPGNYKYYGTNSSGTKGYNSLLQIPLFDHYANAGNTHTDGTEDDLYSDTTAAGQLAANGEKLEAEYGGVFVSSATATRQIKIYFGGTAIFDTGALTLSLSSAWTIYVTIQRVSSSVIRYMISMTTEGAALAAYTAVGELTGLTLSGTNVLKITAIATGVGAAADDIVAKLSHIEWHAAA